MVRSAAIARIVAVALAMAAARVCHADDVQQTPAGPIPAELVDGLKRLQSPAEPARRKVYDLIEQKGDARLIPALKAFAGGTLILRDGRLITYGSPREMPDRTKAYPVLDALTMGPIKRPDGVPVLDPKLDLSKAFRKPLTASARDAVTKLIASLSLLSPDPRTRIASIREAGERAARAFPDAAAGTRLLAELGRCKTALNKVLAEQPAPPGAEQFRKAIAAIDAAASQKPAKLTDAVPGEQSLAAVASTLKSAHDVLDQRPKQAPTEPPTEPPAATAPETTAIDLRDTLAAALNTASSYRGTLVDQKKKLDDLPRYAAALKRQVDQGAPAEFAPALSEATASIDVVLGDRAAKLAAVRTLGEIATNRADNLLRKTVDAARRMGDEEMLAAAEPALKKAGGYQSRVRFAKHTFDGLSSGSILVLLALGLSIIFGLMGVINMAHGEFMMIGAFTTYVVSEWFKQALPDYFDYYPIAAVPAAFLVAGGVGLLVESLVVRHLYGRPLETLLATWGVGLVLIQAVRMKFGDTLSVTPPSWMTGSAEVVPDLYLGLNRIFIVVYCVICVAVVYFIVNRTKLGLLLRATTQNRDMAASLGVATRRVDAITFGVGAGLAGLAGVAVPMYDKINPGMGADYVVESFMVVVVGGVGKLAGAIWAGFGLGFIRQYLEPALQYFPSFDSSASVISQVIVLGLIVAFLQWRPAGLFPPKGRLADA